MKKHIGHEAYMKQAREDEKKAWPTEESDM